MNEDDDQKKIIKKKKSLKIINKRYELSQIFFLFFIGTYTCTYSQFIFINKNMKTSFLKFQHYLG